MRVPIIVANWKMYKVTSEAKVFVGQFISDFYNIETVEVGIASPFTLLSNLRYDLGESTIKLVAQNVHPETEGAFTGEISSLMLKDLGCEYVIVGHSERRQIFGESDSLINEKLRAVLNQGMTPIFCVGETLEQREQNQTEELLESQLNNGLEGVSEDLVAKLVIAYEPVWAIGTGVTASPNDAQKGSAFIRDHIARNVSANAADQVRIQYGGSVKPDNAAELLSRPDVDGALVGGASLEPESFAGIIRAAESMVR